MVVPLDATHLFIGISESFFGDNCTGDVSATYPSGAITVTIESSKSSAKALIEDAITDLSTTQAAIEAALSGIGDTEEAIGSLDKAITRLESSLDSFPGDCKVGKEFFKALQRAVGAIFEAIDEGGISDSAILADLEGVVVEEILEAANIVAAIAIQDAEEDAAGDPNDIAKAKFHFAMAKRLTADGVSVGIAALMFFDEAVGSCRQAWMSARKATGACGPPGRR